MRCRNRRSTMKQVLQGSEPRRAILAPRACRPCSSSFSDLSEHDSDIRSATEQRVPRPLCYDGSNQKYAGDFNPAFPLEQKRSVPYGTTMNRLIETSQV